MTTENQSQARASVWIAMAGFVVPVALLFIGRTLVAPEHAVLGQRLCLGLFVLSELVAMTCGFATRKRPLGKAGVLLSSVLLVVVLGTLFVHLHVR